MFKFIILGAVLIALCLFLYPLMLHSGREIGRQSEKIFKDLEDTTDAEEDSNNS